MKVAGKTGNFYIEALSKVVDGLRDDAFVVAQEVGLENLWKAPSAPRVEETIEEVADGEEETEMPNGGSIQAMMAPPTPPAKLLECPFV